MMDHLHFGFKMMLTAVLFCYFFTIADAAFHLQKSCGSNITDVLTVHQRMWLQTGDAEAYVTANQGKIHLTGNYSFYKVKIQKAALVIEGPKPSHASSKYPDAKELTIYSGEVAVSCKNEIKAKEELSKANFPSISPSEDSTLSSESPITATTSHSTVPTPNPRRERSFTKGLTVEKEPETTPLQTTVVNIPPENLTAVTVYDETKSSSEPTKTTVSDLQVIGNETTTMETSDFLSTAQDEHLPTTTLVPSHALNITLTTSPMISTTRPEVTEIGSTDSEIGNSSSSSLQSGSNSKPWNLKEHMIYIAVGAISIFVILLVIITISIVQCKRKRQSRQISRNNEDFFITSTYDASLLLESEGGQANDVSVRMYSEVEPEAPTPQELEERVLGNGGNESTKSEKPRCLVDGSRESLSDL